MSYKPISKKYAEALADTDLVGALEQYVAQEWQRTKTPKWISTSIEILRAEILRRLAERGHTKNG